MCSHNQNHKPVSLQDLIHYKQIHPLYLHLLPVSLLKLFQIQCSNVFMLFRVIQMRNEALTLKEGFGIFINIVIIMDGPCVFVCE